MAGVRMWLVYALSAVRRKPWWTAWLFSLLLLNLFFLVLNTARADWVFVVVGAVSVLVMWMILFSHLDGPRREAGRIRKRQAAQQRWEEWQRRVKALDEEFFAPQGWHVYAGLGPVFRGDYYLGVYEPPKGVWPREPVFSQVTSDPKKADLWLAQALTRLLTSV